MTKKKIILGIGIPAAIIILVFAAFYFWGWSIQKQGQQSKNAHVTLPLNLNTATPGVAGQQTLLQEIQKQVPSRAIPTGEGKEVKLIQDVRLMQGGQPLPAGLAPLRGIETVGEFPAQKTKSREAPEPLPSAQKSGERTTASGTSRILAQAEEAEEINWPAMAFEHNVPAGSPEAQTAYQETVKIMELVKKYYPVVVQYYGEPYNVSQRMIYFIYDPVADIDVFLPQYDTVYYGSADPFSVLLPLVATFQGNYYDVLPPTWKEGAIYAVSQLVFDKFPEDWGYDPLLHTMLQEYESKYEKYNTQNFPIWGAETLYSEDVGDLSWKRPLLAAMPWLKIYQYDAQILKKVNSVLFQEPLTSEIWQDDRQVFEKVIGVFPAVAENLDPRGWYGAQHVWHQTQENPFVFLMWRLFGQKFAVEDGGIHFYEYKYTNPAERLAFPARPNRTHEIKIKNDQGQIIKTVSGTTNQGGEFLITPNEAGTTSLGRYSAEYDPVGIETHFVTLAEQPYALYGGVQNFGEGKITAYDRDMNLLEQTAVQKGAFHFTRHFQGVIVLYVHDQNQNALVYKEMAKPEGPYFTYLTYLPPAGGEGARQDTAPQEASETAPAPEPAMANLPNLYTCAKYQFSINYPDGFTVYDNQALPVKNLTPGVKLQSESVVQFMPTEGGAQTAAGSIDINWQRNSEQKNLKAFAQDYLVGVQPSLTPLDVQGTEVLVATYTMSGEKPGDPTFQGAPVETKTYFVAQGEGVLIFSSALDVAGVRTLAKMIPTFRVIP